jgi:5-methylcytosine-specific restriction endonuclease McrA
MDSGAFWELGDVTDRDLQAELTLLLASGSRTEARIIAHLAAVEERRLHLVAGSSSLFDYCCHRLGLSESEAFHRIAVARWARRFPVIFGLIEQRAVHLTAVCLLRDYLTPENHRELLEEASGKTKIQVQELLARRFPRADVASTIRKLPPPRAPVPAPALALPRSAPSPEAGAVNVSRKELPPQPPAQAASTAQASHKAVVEPLSAARYRIQLNASVQLKEKREHALDLLSHSNPSGDVAVMIERAVDLLIEQVEKQRFAQTKSPRRSQASGSKKRGRGVKIGAFHAVVRGHTPNDTVRQIVARDGLRCTFVGSDGERCTARKFIQIHHEVPWARGGGETVDNLRMLCAAHNRLLAERDFGRELVESRIAKSTRVTRVADGAEPSEQTSD